MSRVSETSDDRTLTRRQLIAGGVGLVASAATGGLLTLSWRQLAREDLIPGEPPTLQLEPNGWATTHDRLTFAVIGDNGSGGRQAVAVAEQMARSYEDDPFGLVCLLGDICYYGPIARRFDDVFARPMRPLIDAGVRFELAVGNHDGGLFLGDERLSEVEETLALLGTPARYYTVRRGPADFFYLDSETLARPTPDGIRQLEWLDDALGHANADWRIVCTHHPVYSSGIHGPTPRLVELLEPVLVRHRVDLVLAGHDHHYERTTPINGITHVVSGGGCKITPVDPRAFTAVAASRLHFLRMNIDGDRLLARAIAPHGGVLDRFELRATRRS